MKIIRYLLAIPFLLTIGCKKNNSVEPIGQEGYHVSYSEQTVIIEDPGALVSENEEDGTVIVKKSAFEQEPLPGQTILISGEVMKKIKSVSSTGNEYRFETEDAALTDIIREGSIEWTVTPQWADATSLRIDGDEVMSTEGFHAGPIERSFHSGGVEHRIRIEPHTSRGELNACTFSFEMIKREGGEATSRFFAKGVARLPEQHTQIGISNHKLNSFRAQMKGITVDLEIEMAAAGGYSSEHNFKIPKVALSIPLKAIPTPAGLIPLPIPVSIDVGVHFVSQLMMSENASAQAKTKCSISADGGFEYKGTDVEATGNFSKADILEGTFDAAAFLGIPVDLQYGVAFPRISLNIGKQEVAYVHTAFTAGSSLYWGPVCKRGYSKTAIEGGYGLKVLGLELIQSATKTFVESKKEAKGENCE